MSDFLSKFRNAVLGVTMADQPAMMTASGWRQNEKGDYVQDQQNDPYVKQLRDNLAAEGAGVMLGEFGLPAIRFGIPAIRGLGNKIFNNSTLRHQTVQDFAETISESESLKAIMKSPNFTPASKVTNIKVGDIEGYYLGDIKFGNAGDQYGEEIIRRMQDLGYDTGQLMPMRIAGNTIVSVSTKLGASASRVLRVQKPKRRKWKKVKDVKEISADKMQGMTGYKDNIYFFKIKKTKKGPEGKTKYAVLYKTKIKGDGKIGKIKELKKYKKYIGHANGMTAVYNKKSKKVVLYIAPSGEYKGKIVRISVKYNKKKKKDVASKPELIKGYGYGMKGKSYSSISAWKYKNEQFFVIGSGRYCYVCKEQNKRMVLNYTFKLPKPYKPNDKNKTRGQGTACAIKDNIYYYVNSFAYGRDYNNKKKYRKISYVFRYHLSIKNNNIVWKPLKSYEFKVTNQVKAKKNKKNIKRFEMEDLYIYGGKAYLNSEGSDNCLDLIGKFNR